MSYVLYHNGQYVRVEIYEVVNPDDPRKAVFAAWCSTPFRELKDVPKQALTRMVAGPPRPDLESARQSAFDWVKSHWGAQPSRQSFLPSDETQRPAVVYIVNVFVGDETLRAEFVEFADAKTFAKAAEKILGVSKVGITNNESPQFLQVWEKPA